MKLRDFLCGKVRSEACLRKALDCSCIERSAAILFLRNNSLHFEEVGELAAQSEKAVDDACRASCVDWYGNSRPIFVRGRVLALLGYEIVEGNFKEGRMSEMRRINYAPQSARITRGDE